MILPFYQVNAFTNKTFGGNPAAVCVLNTPFEQEKLYTQIANETATPETSFICPLDHTNLQEATVFSLRWFMATHEVKMCGHATLAAAAVLFQECQLPSNTITFKTLSGDITAQRLPNTNWLQLNFPSDTIIEANPPATLLSLLGIKDYSGAVYAPKRNAMVISVANEDELKSLQPDFEALKTHTDWGINRVAVTTVAESKPYDFISRCFCPWIGINEDALSAATHTVIANFWAREWQRNEFYALQASQRTGELKIILHPRTQRADLQGQAVVLIKGELSIVNYQ